MPSQPHHAVQTVHDRAAVVLSHENTAPSGAFWRRWFEKPNERQFADEVRGFISALNHLLDVPPTMLSPGDLASIGEDVQRVAKRIEAEIEAPGESAAEVAASLAPAVYVIRTRYEEMYKRGATKEG